MPDYSHPLGDAVRRSRMKLDLTQSEVAESIDVDVRTVLNIENCKGNPKMEVLYPLVRVLKIDAKEIFYPEMQREGPASAVNRRLQRRSCRHDTGTEIRPDRTAG